MTGLAAGMASEGYHVFTYSIANFPTFRCAEQIRNDVDYQNLAVTVVAVGGGLAYGALGYSHHAVQDYALMRMMPNTLLAAPGDPMEVRACMRYLVANPGPSYLRLGKAGEPCFHPEIPELEPGRWLRLGDGHSDTAIVTTGATMADALAWTRAAESPQVDVYSCPLWGMSTKLIQVEQLSQYQRIVTVEDHLVDGGFGSWLAESAMPALRSGIQLHQMGLDASVCGQVGSQAALNQSGGLTAARLYELIREA